MKKEKLHSFLKDITYGMTYHILEEGKDKDELESIAKKHKLVIPSPDLAIFKGVYAFADKENLNGAILPKDEVEESMPTLTGKAIDFDHLRKKVVGWWLEGSLEDNGEIIAYGVFFKNNLKEDFDTIVELLADGNLKISFEAWAERDPNEDGTYNLRGIHWAGGALLINTDPAFGPKTQVVEMAKKERILEFAKVMTPPKEYFHVKSKIDERKERSLEMSRFSIWDFEVIIRLVDEAGNPKDKDGGFHDILSIDFENGIVKTNWISFTDESKDQKFTIDITPKVQKAQMSSKEERKILSINSEKELKDNTNITLDNKVDTSSTGGDFNNTQSKIAMEEKKNMDETKELKAEVAKLTVEKGADKGEIDSLKVKVEGFETKITDLETKMTDMQTKLDEGKVEKDEAKVERDEAVEQAKQSATVIAERKAEIGDFGKDMSDEDILNDDKFENVKLKKENSELKARGKDIVPGKGSVTLDVGTKIEITDIQKSQKKVAELAFGKQEKE